MTLLGGPLQGVVLRRRHMQWLEASVADRGQGAQKMGVCKIRLRMLVEILAQRLDPLPFDPNDQFATNWRRGTRPSQSAP